MSLIENLNKKIVETYAKEFAELNKNVYKAAKLDDGNYEAPTVSIGNGGGAVLATATDKLPDPAPVAVAVTPVAPVDVVYRLAIPRSEAEIAEKNPAYFNHLFDKVLRQVILNYAATFGGSDKLRFGSHYFEAAVKEMTADDTAPTIDISGNIELRITGSWASDKKVS